MLICAAPPLSANKPARISSRIDCSAGLRSFACELRIQSVRRECIRICSFFSPGKGKSKADKFPCILNLLDQLRESIILVPGGFHLLQDLPRWRIMLRRFDPDRHETEIKCTSMRVSSLGRKSPILVLVQYVTVR